jgi:hypothetical protein
MISTIYHLIAHIVERKNMKTQKRFVKFTVLALIAIMAFALPEVVMAQETDPPGQETPELDDSPENDILVFEPQLYWELPFAQGFKISFNFGISFEMPRGLTLVSEEAFNLFIRFRSFIREDALEPSETPLPEVTPTPEP